MRVSIVAAPWRALAQAARWNGNAPQTTTGEANVRASHCQLVNCSGGIIDRAMTGTVSTSEISSRGRNEAASPDSAVDSALLSSPGAAAGAVAGFPGAATGA